MLPRYFVRAIQLAGRKPFSYRPPNQIKGLAALRTFLLAGIVTSGLLAQNGGSLLKAHDPGPRPNPQSHIPNPVAGLNSNETALFNESLLRVSELEGSCDTCPQQPPNVPPIDPDPANPFAPVSLVNPPGLIPAFNAVKCFICHSKPPSGASCPPHNPPGKIG